MPRSRDAGSSGPLACRWRVWPGVSAQWRRQRRVRAQHGQTFRTESGQALVQAAAGDHRTEPAPRRCAAGPVQSSMPAAANPLLSRHLAKLYEGRSELLECEPRALLHFKMRDFGGFPPCNTCSSVLEQRSDASATHEVSETMPHEDHADLTQARQLTGRAEQKSCYLPSFASVWARSATAMPANTPLASIAIRALAPRTVASPEPASMLRANSPIMLATRTLASTPRF